MILGALNFESIAQAFLIGVFICVVFSIPVFVYYSLAKAKSKVDESMKEARERKSQARRESLMVKRKNAEESRKQAEFLSARGLDGRKMMKQKARLDRRKER